MPRNTRSDLIDAAVRVFDRNGFQATNIDAVIAEAGVSRMTLYNHFASKDELAIAAIERHGDESLEDLGRDVAAAADDPIEQILFAVERHGRWCREPNFRGCLFLHAAGEFPDPCAPIRRAAAAHKQHVRDYFADLCAKAGLDRPRDRAVQILLVLEGVSAVAEVLDCACTDPDAPCSAAAATGAVRAILGVGD
ncbi:MAG: TetR/AcrR family transcriptional regulator [Phycisphaerales bacterium]